MRKLILTTLLLFFFAFGLSLFSGCPVCKCRDEEPYYDFKTIVLDAPVSPIAVDDSLSLFINFGDPEWYFSSTTHSKRSGLGALYACSCEPPGIEGMKYPILAIGITSNQDFDPDHPAGSNLSSLFMVAYNHLQGVFPVDEISSISVPFEELVYLATDARPDSSNLLHKLTVELIKSNGDRVSGTAEIEWD